MKTKIIIATHKKYWMPSDEIYLPLHVGAEGKKDESGNSLDLGYVKDNTGDNISTKNKNYCELTGLYWAWKNLDADYMGLAHYRRHFTVKRRLTLTGRKPANKATGILLSKAEKRDMPITSAELAGILRTTDVVLPRKRNYFIETNYNQYVHAHHAIDLDTTRDVIAERYPEYIKAYDASMKRTSGHRFNMFIMKREYFDRYCRWLFDILFELENRLDISGYSDNDARVFGFVSERLLDVWIDTNRIKYQEIPYVFMENQNWLVKGGNFLKRKFAWKV